MGLPPLVCTDVEIDTEMVIWFVVWALWVDEDWTDEELALELVDCVVCTTDSTEEELASVLELWAVVVDPVGNTVVPVVTAGLVKVVVLVTLFTETPAFSVMTSIANKPIITTMTIVDAKPLFFKCGQLPPLIR